MRCFAAVLATSLPSAPLLPRLAASPATHWSRSTSSRTSSHPLHLAVEAVLANVRQHGRRHLHAVVTRGNPASNLRRRDAQVHALEPVHACAFRHFVVGTGPAHNDEIDGR